MTNEKLKSKVDDRSSNEKLRVVCTLLGLVNVGKKYLRVPAHDTCYRNRNTNAKLRIANTHYRKPTVVRNFPK